MPSKTTIVYRGEFLWVGKIGTVTRLVVMLPWRMTWQVTVLLTVIYKYCLHLTLAYILDNNHAMFEVTLILAETVFFLDVLVYCLHAFWPLVRLRTRVYRRNLLLLAYDIFSLFPLQVIAKVGNFKELIFIARWITIIRIYRILEFFTILNDTMRTSRLYLYLVQHIVMVALLLHACTCLWYNFKRESVDRMEWHKLGYPPHIKSRKISFTSYETCLYYCTCRLFNCIFGDSFPVADRDKWFTILLMLCGYVGIRYRFIGYLTWELMLNKIRWANFLEQYNHVIRYLKFRGAPTWLIQQTEQYKRTLWAMKNGVLQTEHLGTLPLPLQMELIFDINVGHFHDSLLLQDTGEAFMRHISLLVKHELYLAGQHIWSQGVVKGGMICIKRGVVEMLSDEDDESPVIAFKKGTVLGELSLFYSIPSKVTVKAATYVEVQVLHRTDFMRAMAENPRLLHMIRDKIETRLNETKTKQDAIRRNDKNDSRLLRTRYRPMKTLKDHLAGVDEEDSTFVDNSHMYYKDENNVSRAKFTSKYLDLYKISKNVSSIDTPQICLRSVFPWILEPHTNLLRVFDLAHFVIVLYVCVMSPYYVIESTRTDLQRALDTLVYTALLLNIYVQLTTAIVVKNERRETVREIAEEKMSTVGFYLDVLSIFPLYIFADTLDPKKESILSQLVKLLPMVQVWHVWDYFQTWQKGFNANAKLLCLLTYTLLFTICCYWSGCLLYIVACPKKLCKEKSWMAQIVYWETKVLLTNNPKHERPLLTSLLFGTSVFTGAGMSETAPGPTDYSVVIILCIIGTYFACFYTAKICSFYMLSTQRKVKFKESMRELFYFLSVNHVSDKIKKRVEKFFRVQWYYNKAVSNEEIFKDLSTNIQQEILSGDMIQSLKLCPMFEDCSQDFLQTVATNTRTIVLPDDEIVQHACDIGRDMYIVKMGHCNNLDHNGRVVSTLGPGSSIGVVEMLFGLPKVYTVVTTTNCILIHVEYTSLMQCWDTFPEVSCPIQETLEDPVIRTLALRFEVGKPLVGKIDTKTNRITREIKESFVVLNGPEYVHAFDRLGILRYVRYFFFPVSITPHGLFLKWWCVARLLCTVYYVIVIPYNIATSQMLNGGGYYWSDLFLYVDMLVMAYVAYYNHNSLLVTHPLFTVTRYLRHGFLLDIISIFPFEDLCKIVIENIDTDLYRLNRILLVSRISSAFRYWEGDIMSSNQAVVMLKFLPLALVFVNSVTAITFANSCVCYTRPQFTNYILTNCTKIFEFTSSSHRITFAVNEYISTFNWIFEVFLGVGCTPINLINRTDTLMLMTLQVTGMLYFACMFGHVASARTAASHELLAHNEETKDLANFLYQENVDSVLMSKTMNHFKYLWRRTHGSDPQKICRGLNSALMEDTLVYMYEKALREVPLFGKVERSFIRVITQHLQEMYFLMGDAIVQCKDIQTNIYIIYRGKVDVMSSYNEMLTCMGPGGMFGNFTGKPLSCSQVAIYASRSLDLLVIPSQTFFTLIKYYPKVQDLLNRALEMSSDYILPITMDTADDDSSDYNGGDVNSQDSAFESRSGSSRFGSIGGKVALSVSRSRSNVSQAKSGTSVTTVHSYMNVENLLRPGSRLFQVQGYITCFMTTANYILVSYEIWTLNDCYFISWCQALFDVFFYLKIYLLINEGYINRHGNLIIDPIRCRHRYFRHKMWLCADIFANFPLEIFGFFFKNPLSAFHYLRANKLFRLKYIVQFYRYTSTELTNNLTTLQTAMTCVVVMISIHTLSCGWLLALILTMPTGELRTVKLHVLDENASQFTWDYVTSLYLMVAELTTTGGDEFMVNMIIPITILAVSVIAGKILAAAVVATSMQMAHSDKYTLNKYERITNELMDFLKNQGLSSYQSTKFWKYIQQLWVTERGRQLPVLISRAPYVMRCDLMSAMFGTHLRNCYLFADTGEPFLRQLCALLDYTVYFPGNYIVMAGDSEARMHWVESGVVAVVSVRADLTETTYEQLNPGDVFGILQGLNKGIPHTFSYRAENKVGTLSLSADSWKNIVLFFPEAKKIILQRSEMLFTKII